MLIIKISPKKSLLQVILLNRLKILELENNNLVDNEMMILLQGISENESLTTLNLSKNQFTDKVFISKR